MRLERGQVVGSEARYAVTGRHVVKARLPERERVEQRLAQNDLVELLQHLAKAVLEAMIVKNQVSGAIAGTLARASAPVEKEKAAKTGNQRIKRQSA